MHRDDDDDNYNDENSDWQRMSVAKAMMAVDKLVRLSLSQIRIISTSWTMIWCDWLWFWQFTIIFSDSDYFDELDDDELERLEEAAKVLDMEEEVGNCPLLFLIMIIIIWGVHYYHVYCNMIMMTCIHLAGNLQLILLSWIFWLNGQILSKLWILPQAGEAGGETEKVK